VDIINHQEKYIFTENILYIVKTEWNVFHTLQIDCKTDTDTNNCFTLMMVTSSLKYVFTIYIKYNVFCWKGFFLINT